MNRLFFLFVTALFAISASANEAYDKRVGDAIRQGLEAGPGLNAKHFRCFKCGTGRWPTSVDELRQYAPQSGECSELFSTVDFSETSHIPGARISVDDSGQKVLVLFAREGVTFDNMTLRDTFVIRNFPANELQCASSEPAP